jgi:hypothetical protein
LILDSHYCGRADNPTSSAANFPICSHTNMTHGVIMGGRCSMCSYLQTRRTDEKWVWRSHNDFTRSRRQSYELRRYAGALSCQFSKRLRRDTWSTDHVQRLDRLRSNELLKLSMLPKNSSDTGVLSPSYCEPGLHTLSIRASVPISSVRLLDTYK